MTNQLFFAALLLVLGVTHLPAQTPDAALHLASTNEATVNTLVDQLNQNALWVLAAIVALMGFTWLCFVGATCAGLTLKNKNSAHPSCFVVLCLAVGLNTLVSSCAASQQTQVTSPQAARASESGPCTCHPFCNNYQPAPGYGTAYNQSSYRFSNGTGLAFCKHCGRPLYNH